MINYMALEYHRLVKKRLWGFVGENSLEMNKLEFHFCYLRILDVFHKFMKFINLCHFLLAQMVKHLPTMRETRVQSLGREDLLEKEMATHSSILTWKIPWMEELGRLQSMGLQRVGHDWATFFFFLRSHGYIWEKKMFTGKKKKEICLCTWIGLELSHNSVITKQQIYPGH